MNSINRFRLKNGSAIVYGLVIMFAVSIILTSLIGFVGSQLKYSFRQSTKEASFQIAESGVNYYKWYLAHTVEGKTAKQVQDFWESGDPQGVVTPYEAEFFDPGGTAIGKYKLTVTPPAIGSTIVIVESVGWTYKNPEFERVIRVRFRRPSWSESSVLANDTMRFGSGTTVNGKIHSNKGIRFDGVANNLVTSSVSSYDDPDHSDSNKEFGVHTHVNVPPSSGINDTYRSAEAPTVAHPTPALRTDVFKASREFPVPTVDFTSVLADLNVMKSTAQTGGGVYLNSSGAGRHITLKSNGTFDSCTVNEYDTSTFSITSYTGVISGATGSSSGTNGNACITTTTCASGNYTNISSSKPSRGKCMVSYSNTTIPNNNVIFVENNIWLEGTINHKKVSIVAADIVNGSGAKNVYIGKDVLYTNHDGTDILGVIGQNNIEIPFSSNNVLNIEAALLAQNGRVGRANYGTSDHKSTITINGAIATNQRYGFAWISGSTSWGYTTRNLYYDNNLLYYPPPFFPTGSQYQMDLWEEL